MVSKSLEEYLKTMYVLQKQNGHIRVTDVAEKMNISKPSVNKAVNNLKSEGLVNYQTYGLIKLTETGNSLACKILERYDIVNLFLREVLNIEKKKAQEEAEKIKLAMSDETMNALARYVHKELGLYSLDCNYDLNNEKCRNCVRRKKSNKEKEDNKNEDK